MKRNWQKINGHAFIKSVEYSSGIAASRGLVKFSAVFGNLEFMIVFTRSLHWSLLRATWGSGLGFASLSTGEMNRKQGGGARPRNTNHISTPHFFTIYSSIPRLSDVFFAFLCLGWNSVFIDYIHHAQPVRTQVYAENGNGRERVSWKKNMEIEVKK